MVSKSVQVSCSLESFYVDANWLHGCGLKVFWNQNHVFHFFDIKPKDWEKKKNQDTVHRMIFKILIASHNAWKKKARLRGFVLSVRSLHSLTVRAHTVCVKNDSLASALCFDHWQWSWKIHFKTFRGRVFFIIVFFACNNAEKAEVWALVLLAQADTQMSWEVWRARWVRFAERNGDKLAAFMPLKFPPYCAVAISQSAVSVLLPQCFTNSVTWHRCRHFADG